MVSAIHQHESALATHVFHLSWNPFHLPSYPIPLGCPRAPALFALFHVSNWRWSPVLHLTIYLIQCDYVNSSCPCLLLQSSKVCSLHLCLFSCPICRIIVTAVGGFNAPVTLMDGSTKQKSNKNREWYSGPIRPNWYLQSIPHQNNGFHLFLKCTWIILKARTHPGPQI